MQKALELLEEMIRRGFLLHGSQRQIAGAVEPRQARCSTGRPQGCLVGIYADDQLRAPCIRATVTPLNSSCGYSSSYSANGDNDLMIVTGENVTFKPGYVYVLPKTTFLNLDSEIVSSVPVMPNVVVKVTPDILRLLPNMDIRIPAPTSW